MKQPNSIELPLTFNQLSDVKRFFILGTGKLAHDLHLLLAGRFQNRFFGFFSNEPSESPDITDQETAYYVRPLAKHLDMLGPGDYLFLTERNERLEKIVQSQGARLGFARSLHNCFSTYEAPVFDTFLRDHFTLKSGSHSVKAQGLALDIGANFGMTAAAISPYFDEVRAFEPNRNLFDNIERNNTLPENIKAFRIAFGESVGQSEFFDMNGVNGSLVRTEGCSSYMVDVDTIDNYCQTHGIAPDFIKIDAENMDAEILFSASQTIRDHKPIIFFENPFNFVNAQTGGSNQETAEALYGLLNEFYNLKAYPCLNQPVPYDCIGMDLEECRTQYAVHPLNIAAIPKQN